MPLPTVAIVGRPNVGKSSLLNALARRQISIVDPRPGITRDRVCAVVEHADRYFEAIDTGGFGIVDSDHLESHVEEQILLAVRTANVILFVVDVQNGITALDRRVAELLRRLSQPVILVANKVDTESHVPQAAEFMQLGYGEALEFSAKHFRGRTELLDRVAALLPDGAGAPPGEPVMKLAIVGKRNAGKSTLVNALAGEARVIVSEVPGTTRDAVDVRFVRDGREYIAIDTAGVRKKSKMQDIEFYSHTRATRSIRRADVVLMLIESQVPIADADRKLARFIADEYKPVMLVVNKWDLAKETAATEDFGEYLTRCLPEIDYAPIAFITARERKNLDAMIDTALALHKQAHTRIGTGQLNAAMEHVVSLQGPSSRHGNKPIKIYYATQVGTAPPTIVMFCNDPSLVGESYRRFMENKLREMLPFGEIPLRLLFRPRQGREKESA